MVRQVLGIAHNYRQSAAFRLSRVRDISAHHSAQAEDQFSYFRKAQNDITAHGKVAILKHPRTGGWDVARPEAELVVLYGARHRPVAITLGNDFTLGVELEGRYQAQGKWFDGTWWGKSRPGLCSYGPVWHLLSGLDCNLGDLRIELEIFRGTESIFCRSFRVGDWRWSLEEVPERVVTLWRKFGHNLPPSKEVMVEQEMLPAGTAIFLGTGIIVPPRAYSLEGDIIVVSSPKLGVLRNEVIRVE